MCQLEFSMTSWLSKIALSSQCGEKLYSLATFVANKKISLNSDVQGYFLEQHKKINFEILYR